MNYIKNFFITTFVLLKIIMINTTYTFYHLYMRKKIEFESRMLNILYAHIAVLLQLGSLINLLLILHELHVWEMGKWIYLFIYLFLSVSHQAGSSSLIIWIWPKTDFSSKCATETFEGNRYVDFSVILHPRYFD